MNIVSLFRPKEEAAFQRVQQDCGEQIACALDAAQQAALLPQAEVLLGSQDCGEDLLQRCPRLKMLYVLSAGVEHLPFDLLEQRGIRVANASGVHGPQIAEYVMGTILGFQRGLLHAVRQKAAGSRNAAYMRDEHLLTAAGKTLCIVGAGAIGRAVAQRAAAFGMRVTGVRRHGAPLPDFAKTYTTADLRLALPEADFIVLLTPLTPETYHLIGQAELACMKPTAVLINVARGDVVDEQALIRALRDGKLRGAGLDVTSTEPLPQDSPLWDLDNVVLTHHTAGIVRDYVGCAMQGFPQNYRAFVQGAQTMPTEVDLRARY